MKKKIGEGFKKGDPVYWDAAHHCLTSRNSGTELKGYAKEDVKAEASDMTEPLAIINDEL